ncbi:MAG TPA: biotin--[acetyl-CoA-carboxylase] ligase, partial [Blastocatellia bacterium]
MMNKLGSTLIRLDTVTSTNDIAREMAGRGAEEGLVVTAKEQSAGRGRKGREWASPAGEGLYLSLLLRPRIRAADASLLSLSAALAVAETLRFDFRIEADIKWPNDILVNERKVCGILVEVTSTGPDTHRIILGIGVNLNHRSFPPELRVTATSLRLETGEPVAIDEFRDQLLELIAYWYEQWLK